MYEVASTVPLGEPVITVGFVADRVSGLQLYRADFSSWALAIFSDASTSPTVLLRNQSIATVLSDTLTPWTDDAVRPGWNFRHDLPWNWRPSGGGVFRPVGGQVARIEYHLIRTDGTDFQIRHRATFTPTSSTPIVLGSL